VERGKREVVEKLEEEALALKPEGMKKSISRASDLPKRGYRCCGRRFGGW
jgi:hypothetical protein